MEWIWALFGVIWTYLVGGAALWCWRAPERWAKRGFLSNGLGTTITISEDPKALRRASFGMKMSAMWLSAMAIGGGIVTVGWISRAI
jgi:hypothetical protein